MRKLLGILIFSAILVGCNDTSLEKERENQLLAKIDSIQVIADQMEQKGKMVALALKNSEFASPSVVEFFNSDSFWKNTYDVGYSGCSSNCGQKNKDAMADCEEETDPIKKAICDRKRRKEKISCDSLCIVNWDPTPM